MTLAAALIFILCRRPLINLYLTGEGSPGDIAKTAELAGEYIVVMLAGLLPFAISQAYAFSVFSSIAVGAVAAAASPFLPYIYKTSDAIRHMATRFLLISGLCMPIYAFASASYFTMRSGGKTWLMFILDSGCQWMVRIPFTAALVYLTGLDVITLFLLCQLIHIIKCAISYTLVAKKIWVNRLV